MIGISTQLAISSSVRDIERLQRESPAVRAERMSNQADFAAMQHQRHVRSFVLRAGRMTPAQERALKELWPVYGVELRDAPLDLETIFGRRAPRCLEIGFGVGEVIGTLAEERRHIDYLGIEVHAPGVGRLLLRAEQAHLGNLRVIRHDAVEVL